MNETSRFPCILPPTTKTIMDTVIIKIHGADKFKIANKSWFLPEISRRQFYELTPTEKQSTRMYLRRFILQPPITSGYLPKVDVLEVLNKDRDNIHYVLRAEFSVPKLIYGNSLQEVSSNDLEKALYAFKKALGNAGITVESNTVANARVSATHFCKNVLLPRDIRMQEILTELTQIDISKVVDVTKKEFKHGGQSLQIYSGTREWVFYDKIADAMRPKIKRKYKQRVGQERGIIERHNLQQQEVFRFEYRIKLAISVEKCVNGALGRTPKTPVLFRDLFTHDLCRKVVLNAWRELIQRPENQLALLAPVEGLGLFDHILAEALKTGGAHSMNHALTSYGLASAIRDHGAKEVRRAILRGWVGSHPERLTRKIEAAAELTRGLPYSNSIAFVDKALESYPLITVDTLQKRLIM
jgi:ribosomal protein S21